MRNELINLIIVTNTIDNDGFQKNVESKVQVFAEKKSVKRLEFYEALRNNMSLSYIFDVYLPDYEYACKQNNGEEPKKLEFGTKKYKIVRSFASPDNDSVELTCEGL